MRDSYILIVEDESPIRAMIHYALKSDGFKAKEAEDTKEAQQLISEELPELILLDWMLPNLSGVTFTKMLKQDRRTQNIPIIMLTAKADEENKVTGLEAGADDYIVKPFSPRELTARIRAVLRRGPLKQPDGTVNVRDIKIDVNDQRVTVAGDSLRLGPLEYRLLLFFALHRDRVFSRDELLNHVWGTDAYVDERTVDVHIRRLRKMLEAYGHDTLIQTVHGSGYRFSEKEYA